MFTAIVLCSFPLFVGDATPSESGDVTVDLMRSVIARRNSIHSGIIEYTRVTGQRSTGVDGRRETRHRVSISGNDWARRFPGTPNATVNSSGRLLVFAPSPRRDGTPSFALHIEKPKSFTDIEKPSPSVALVGTLWDGAPGNFIAEHLTSVRSIGRQVIGTVETEVLELDVPKSGRAAAFGILNALLEDGGKLRLNVAETLGYALARIEYVGRGDIVARRIESSDFREDAPGLFIPRRCSSQWFDPNPVYYCDFEIEKVELINKPIPIEEFQLEIPSGTFISDSRGAVGSVNFVLDVGRSSKLLDDVPILTAPLPSKWFPAKIALVVANIAFFFVLVCVITVRYWKKAK